MQVECPICLENLESECVTLSCKHQFHKKCINKAIWIFEAENIIDFKLNTCPICRNHLTCNDKRITITGNQFTRVIDNILRSDIENKPKLSREIYDAYEQIYDTREKELLETEITADETYKNIVSWRDTMLEDIECGDFDIRHTEVYRDYNIIIDICKRYFDFV
jgi:hypothetical protein